MTEPHPHSWTPSLGAWIDHRGTSFRVWAPLSRTVEVIVRRDGADHRAQQLERSADGTFSATIAGLGAGDRYVYRLDGDRRLPDPASRSQPDGVHGPSEIVNPGSFNWTDGRWTGVALEHAVFYELHVGAFSPEGTFAGAAARLPDLASLGVTMIELMPIAAFPGARNWGYDGAALFAPAAAYGTPDDLRRFVDLAHALGLGVCLDVVYNHLGPDGAYLSAFSPFYFTERHQTPWGAGVNVDGEHSEMVRAFFVENAQHWVHEYHVDALRLDATHAIVDESSRPFVAELGSRVRASAGRRVLVVAEDYRNLSVMLKDEREGGWGLDAVWADDFHHECRRLLAGDADGYYRDYAGTTTELATTIRRGWFFDGQFSTHLGAPRGTDPSGIDADCFVICLQNHDQVGNRALGERLNHQIAPPAFRAVSALLLLAPETPLVFMGQEWAASTPFLYFTDHNAELGRLVTEGRREEFRHFPAFSDASARARIPDPQSVETFLKSRLDWRERAGEPHASIWRLYQALLSLRRREPALRDPRTFEVSALDAATVALVRKGARAWTIVARLTEPGPDAAPATIDGHWEVVLDTEDPSFSPDPVPSRIDRSGSRTEVRFGRAAAVILRA